MKIYRRHIQAGFTLVELAIVMIIIGLLIGGVLKGQQLIINAQVTAEVAQVKSIDAAITSFHDQYQALPGDIVNPSTRLPNCAVGTPCATGGDGNGYLNNAVGQLTPPGVSPLNTEAEQFFDHLGAAGLIAGISGQVSGTWGGEFPAGKISGTGFQVGWSDGTAGRLTAPTSSIVERAGLYLVVMPAIGFPYNLEPPTDQPLTTNEAERIDTKLDDGMPNTGDVRAYGSALCVPAATATDVYLEASQGNVCGLYIHIQN